MTGADQAQVLAERERQRRLFAFLYSTPAYRRTLELYGWAELGVALQAMVRQDRWDDLPALVTDGILDELVPSATFEELPALVAARFAPLGHGVLIPPPARPEDDGRFAEVLRAVRTL